MIENERVLHDVAGALMDGAPIDWASAESKADNESMRRIVRELKVIAAIADVHGTSAVSSDSPSVDAEAGNLSSGTHGYSLADDPLSDAFDLNRRRLDVSGSVSRAVAKSIAVYGGVGRTLSRADANSTRLSLSGGVITFFNGPAPSRRKPRR